MDDAIGIKFRQGAVDWLSRFVTVLVYLIAAGESPVARALLRLGKPLGFRTVAMGVHGPGVDEVYEGIAFDRLSPYRVPFVVVATMGVDDEAALLAALALNLPYLALVGSRRRFETVADLLREQGADAERVAAIRVPAGLDIGAETPAEIALSILAEAVQVRRDLRLSGKLTLLGPAEDEPPASQIVIDPICGMEVDLATARHTLVVDGETLGFCCPGCLYEYRQRMAG